MTRAHNRHVSDLLTSHKRQRQRQQRSILVHVQLWVMDTRREFLKTATGVMAGSLVVGCGSDTSTSDAPGNNGNTPTRRPNILLLLVDEMRQPPPGYAPNQGEVPDVKEILSFAKQLSADNSFAQFFPGLLRLRQNSAVLRNHYIAAAACSPSRTTFLTGQYPSLHGVTQVTGTFSIANEVQYLDATGVPTAGDWFRAAGYDSYYFGKWHVSDTSEATGVKSLEDWGFSDYTPSFPEPDSSTPNLGVYRDPGFTETISSFFESKQGSDKPWFAVASFLNPHDNGAYPAPFFGPTPNNPSGLFVTPGLTNNDTPRGLPDKGVQSFPSAGRIVDLNPGGFPQQCFNLPPTAQEDLSSKPDCHLDSAWKVQMALAAALPINFQKQYLPYPMQALPSPLRENWALAFGQFYIYLQYLVDLELEKILKAFDDAGLDKNTIIVFTSDHGAMTMGHGLMVQKFFNAYEEAMRVPFVISSPLVNPSGGMLEFTQPTSHVDLLPTLLGLAGFSNSDIKTIQGRITGHTQVRDLVGLNLVPLLARGLNLPRPGVLFTTSDDPTRLPPIPNPDKQSNYDDFITRVNDFVDNQGAPMVRNQGAVEPNSVHMLCTGDWKYARYIDDNLVEPDQFEFYHLPSDPNEANNLVDHRSGQLRPLASVAGLTSNQLQGQLILIRAQLAQQEANLLLTPV